jgi:hypothetical protein
MPVLAIRAPQKLNLAPRKLLQRLRELVYQINPRAPQGLHDVAPGGPDSRGGVDAHRGEGPGLDDLHHLTTARSSSRPRPRPRGSQSTFMTNKMS